MKIFTLVFVIAISSATVTGQVKSPVEFMPHAYTKAFTPHHLLRAYFESVAAESPSVILEETGETYEHRPQFLAIVSSPENIARIEELRLNNLRLAGLAPGKASTIDAPAIVWLGYSVHGNEAGGSEASMQVLYDLVTGKNGAAEWLKKTIVILEPSVNPDGYNRYTNWNNQVSSMPYNMSTDAREHHEPWPGGRVNHYLFDLNRDWAWQTQQESRNRLAAYQRWMPHVVADLHEMGYQNPYYFAPAAQPYHALISEWQRDFQVAIGKHHARYFDKNGWAYFTREIFDLFYPSYGDTYPVFNGAIGMTYEQGGHGFAGRAIGMPNGDTLKLADRIAHHETTSLSTIEVTANNAEAVVREFAAYFQKAMHAPGGNYGSYVIKGTNPPGRVKALLKFLDMQGITYGSVVPGQAFNGFSYALGTSGRCTLEKGDIVVSAYQPRSVLTQVLFDFESALQDSLTYDITSWSLPFAYGVDVYAVKERIAPQPYQELVTEEGTVSTDAYAYALAWNSLEDARFLAAALEAGFQARFADQPFSLEGQSFAAGTAVFLRSDNKHHEAFPEGLLELRKDYSVSLQPVHTGFVSIGRDFGSSAYHLISAPHVLTFAGDRVSANEFGQIWYFFEQVLHYPLTVSDIDDLGSVEWDTYDVLILPEGYYSLSESVLSSIQDWVRSGGKVIAIGSALSQFADKDGFALKRFAEEKTESEVDEAEEEERLSGRLDTYAGSERRDISGQIPGAVFRADLDPTHPLAFGLGDHYYSLKTGTSSYEHLTDADNVIYLKDDLTHFGFAGSKALARQKNSIIAAVEQSGSGSIVYLVDNPLFRGFWENGQFLFCNALFFAGN